MSVWVDKGSYFLHTGVQGGKDWLAVREEELLLTASKFGSVAHGSRFESEEEIVQELCGIKKERSEESKMHMKRGVRLEPQIRTWFEGIIGVKIHEISIAKPKFDQRIGGSPDGAIYNEKGKIVATIEIKACKKMYSALCEYMKKIAQGWIAPPHYHEHIWDSHYAQMQGCMAIVEAEYCMYIVVCEDSGEKFVQKVMYNKSYWEGELYPRLQAFLAKHEKRIVQARKDRQDRQDRQGQK